MGIANTPENCVLIHRCTIIIIIDKESGVHNNTGFVQWLQLKQPLRTTLYNEDTSLIRTPFFPPRTALACRGHLTNMDTNISVLLVSDFEGFQLYISVVRDAVHL